MTSPLFLVAAGRLADARVGGQVLLDGAEGRHAATVRRLAAGEPVDVADGSGRVARCVVVLAEKASLTLEVVDVDDVPPRLPRLVLVQALAKGGRDELAIETATELGVDEVVPWQAARSIVKWSGERAARSRERWVDAVREAAKQSRRASVPVVAPLCTTAQLAQRAAAGAQVLVLHEQATSALVTTALPEAGSAVEVLMVVGPEGGIDDAEVALLTAAGAAVVRLGPEVLRSSSAGPAALAVLSARLGRWA